MIGGPPGPSASRARAVAKLPTPITRFGSHHATSRRRASSQTSNSGSRSAAGSLSGVRLRPESSMNTSGQ